MVTTLIVKDIVGSECITMDDGSKIYEFIFYRAILSPFKDKKIELDFAGVGVIAPPFLNAIYYPLFCNQNITIEFVQENILVKNMFDWEYKMLNRVIDNSYRYHHDSKYRDAIDTVMRRASIDGV